MVNQYKFSGDAKITFSGDTDDIPLGVVHPPEEIHLVNGHKIASLPEAIECPHCDTRVEIPSLIRQSSGFVESVYRLHIIGDMDICTGSPTNGGSCSRQSMKTTNGVMVSADPANNTTMNNMSDPTRTVSQSITVGDVSTGSDDDGK